MEDLLREDPRRESVTTTEAVALISGAIPRRAGTWADLGAGDGTFTRALVELLAESGRIFAVDRDARAIAALERWTKKNVANVIPVVSDFTGEFELPGLGGSMLDGMIFANALHFVRDADVVLTRLVARVRLGGRVVFIEYDQRNATRWVPYPIPVDRLPALAAPAGLSTPVITATRPSAFGGNLYVAATDRLVKSSE
jgi:ubiquinone/menaquinone biosynthesis C-methylase UbiE